jgi:hypothetical protein
MKALPDGWLFSFGPHNSLINHRFTGLDEHPHFLRYATELAAMLRHTIFVDRVVYHSSPKTDVLELLEEHITENIVKVSC